MPQDRPRLLNTNFYTIQITHERYCNKMGFFLLLKKKGITMSGMNVGGVGDSSPHLRMSENESDLNLKLQHHPDLQKEYNHVERELSTFAEKTTPGGTETHKDTFHAQFSYMKQSSKISDSLLSAINNGKNPQKLSSIMSSLSGQISSVTNNLPDNPSSSDIANATHTISTDITNFMNSIDQLKS
jgi:hypothetical protein